MIFLTLFLSTLFRLQLSINNNNFSKSLLPLLMKYSPNDFEEENHEWIAIHNDTNTPKSSKTNLIELENLRHQTVQLENDNSFEIFVALTIPKKYLIGSISDYVLLSGIAPGKKGLVKIYSIQPHIQCLLKFELPEGFSPYSGTICATKNDMTMFDHIFTNNSASPIDLEDFIRIPPEEEIDPNTIRIILSSPKGRILIYRFMHTRDAGYDMETSLFLCQGMEMPRNFCSHENLALFSTCDNSLCLMRTPIRDENDCKFYHSNEITKAGGPMILTTPDPIKRIWMGTIGGGIIQSFSLDTLEFNSKSIILPESSKCLHFMLTFRDEKLQDYLFASVSGEPRHKRHSEMLTEGIARLLVYSTNPDQLETVLLHIIDFTLTLERCLEATTLSEPVDLTLNRFMIHNNKQIWLITRGGIIFNCTYDELITGKFETDLYSIYLSCHCFKRPLSHIFSATYDSDRDKNVVISIGHEYLKLYYKTTKSTQNHHDGYNISTCSGANMILWS